MEVVSIAYTNCIKRFVFLLKKTMTTPEGTPHDEPPPGQEVEVGPAPPPPAPEAPRHYWAGDGEGLISAGPCHAVVLGPAKVWYLSGGITEQAIEGEVICVSQGGDHIASVLNDGRVLTCGSNDNGQLGRPAPPEGDTVFRPIPGINNAIGVACGYNSTIVVMRDGSAVAFGENRHGEFRSWRRVRRSDIPVLVEGVENVISIGAGKTHNAIVTADGRVATWGENDFGQLGRDGRPEDIPRNGRVSVCGGGTEGDSPSYFLGLGDGVVRQDIPAMIPELENVSAVSISTGDDYDCFVLALHFDGSVSIFGNGAVLLDHLGLEISRPEVIEGFNALRW
jgi:hypothetical protein